MHKVQCNDCQGQFSRRDVLKLHQSNVNEKTGMPSPTAVAETLTPTPPQGLTPPPLQEVTPTSPKQPSLTVPSQQRQERFVFKHPFTANISGPTCCSKTYFCKMLLQHCLKMIWPPPGRIVWLYKRWQPLYGVIQNSLAQGRI